MAQKQTSNKEQAEVVLLRHPLPKYNFQGRKLPKEPSTIQPTSISASTNQSDSISSSVSSLPSHRRNTKETGLPTAVSHAVSRHGSRKTLDSASGVVMDRKSATVRPLLASSRSEPAFGHDFKPRAAVVAPSVRSVVGAEKDTGENRTVGATSGSVRQESLKVAPSAEELQNKGREVRISYLPSPPSAASPESVDIPVPDAGLLAHVVEGPGLAERLEQKEKEVAMLRSQLDVQLQVNSEIKRLLVASVGEDFERKVENLARDRAELAMELGDFTKKMTEDYENLDQISIQADMWRSKYLASRVMVEELASARAFYSSQFQDSQLALQELLNERYELRTMLLHSYKILQQVKEAFDPLNSQKSHSLASTNVLDLSKQIKELSEAVRFRLLPAHAGSHIIMPLEESWESTMTRAELLAYDQLSKETTPPSFKHSIPSSLQTSSSTKKSFERFHPMVRHDNLTVNCCRKCKGEIKLA